EALHLASLLCQHGYFFPVGDAKTLQVKDDSSLYRFQTPYYWPSRNHVPDSTDYAIYLHKKIAKNKQKHGLEDCELEGYHQLKKTLASKWDFVAMQADEQLKMAKDRKKGDKIVSESQERAYWRVYRPPPGFTNALEMPPVPDRSRHQSSRAPTVATLKRDLSFLKMTLGRLRMKISQVAESMLSHHDTYLELDPFLSPVQPSNPWLTDDPTFMELNEPLVEFPTERRVRRWAISMEETVSDPTGLHEFTSCMRKEFSHENIRFWSAVHQLKKMPLSQVPDEVRHIYDEFLRPGAPCEINIDGKTMERTQELLKNPTRFTYDYAADHIFDLLLKKDCYPRFLRSEHYKNLLTNATNPTSKKSSTSSTKKFFTFGAPGKKKISSVTPPNISQLVASSGRLSSEDQSAVASTGGGGAKPDCEPPYRGDLQSRERPRPTVPVLKEEDAGIFLGAPATPPPSARPAPGLSPSPSPCPARPSSEPPPSTGASGSTALVPASAPASAVVPGAPSAPSSGATSGAAASPAGVASASASSSPSPGATAASFAFASASSTAVATPPAPSSTSASAPPSGAGSSASGNTPGSSVLPKASEQSFLASSSPKNIVQGPGGSTTTSTVPGGSGTSATAAQGSAATAAASGLASSSPAAGTPAEKAGSPGLASGAKSGAEGAAKEQASVAGPSPTSGGSLKGGALAGAAFFPEGAECSAVAPLELVPGRPSSSGAQVERKHSRAKGEEATLLPGDAASLPASAAEEGASGRETKDGEYIVEVKDAAVGTSPTTAEYQVAAAVVGPALCPPPPVVSGDVPAAWTPAIAPPAMFQDMTAPLATIDERDEPTPPPPPLPQSPPSATTGSPASASHLAPEGAVGLGSASASGAVGGATKSGSASGGPFHTEIVTLTDRCAQTVETGDSVDYGSTTDKQCEANLPRERGTRRKEKKVKIFEGQPPGAAVAGPSGLGAGAEAATSEDAARRRSRSASADAKRERKESRARREPRKKSSSERRRARLEESELAEGTSRQGVSPKRGDVVAPASGEPPPQKLDESSVCPWENDNPEPTRRVVVRWLNIQTDL
ncbi:regulator of G-protein signaling 9-like, partial [Amphibalanus amphitrite]|uniref:regulator of G-protein signaling 9-like n=1 Tax=Amphibalanus amphitrite TaxID=1232801 RepID=UPI001C92A3DD